MQPLATITIQNMFFIIISSLAAAPPHINIPTAPPSTIKAELSSTTECATPPQNMVCLLKILSLVRNVK